MQDLHEQFFLLSMLVCGVSFRVVSLYFGRNRVEDGGVSVIVR